ncbi:MAG: AMP-binding protein [Oscillospiraceae bacterium]|nr:AMP-binding protein [Oscillospiraceae bacterium]
MKQLSTLTVGRLLEETAEKFPTRQAVKYTEVDYDQTYYRFNAHVDRVAKGLMGMGFEKGDHVAVWATNYPEWLVLFFATAKIGVVLVTVNTNYKENELEYLLKQSDSKALFLCDGLKDIDCGKIIYSLCPELKTAKKGQLDSVRLPVLRSVICFDSNDYPGMYRWSEIESFGVLVSPEEYRARKDSLCCNDVINMQYTSGTTGFPKGVMLTHKNIVNNGISIGECMKFTQEDRLCIPVPFFHCFGLVLGILACVAHGSTMLPLLWYAPMKVMRLVEYERCTALHGVPTMFIGILQHRDFDKYDFSSLRTGIMAGSPCPVKVMQDVIDKMHMRDVTIAYGQTEASPVCTQTTTEDSIENRVNTVGKVLPFMEAKVVDPESGKEVGVGESGEFCVRGYNVMKGYYDNHEATAAAIDAEGWLHSGDLATVDAQGYYKITGRIKDMIIRGGENIFPKEIEDLIYTHPAVKDVAVVAIPSEKYGEEVCAVIIRKEDEMATESDIQEFVNRSLAKHKVPSRVLFVDCFPLTASGKVQKFILRARAVGML